MYMYKLIHVPVLRCAGHMDTCMYIARLYTCTCIYMYMNMYIARLYTCIQMCASIKKNYVYNLTTNS